MARNYFIHNRRGYFELMKGSETASEITRRAEAVKNTANSFGGTYACHGNSGSQRFCATVYPADTEALESIITSNSLLKSIDAAR